MLTNARKACDSEHPNVFDKRGHSSGRASECHALLDSIVIKGRMAWHDWLAKCVFKVIALLKSLPAPMTTILLATSRLLNMMHAR